MNEEQKANIENCIHKLAINQTECWQLFDVLEQLNTGAKKHPQVLEKYPNFLSIAWASIFNSLLLKESYYNDRTKEVLSLHKLFKMLRKYLPADHELCVSINTREDELKRKAEFITNRRNEILAHLTDNSTNADFYEKNKMSLQETKAFLEYVDATINLFSTGINDTYNDMKPDSNKQEIIDLFAALSNTK